MRHKCPSDTSASDKRIVIFGAGRVAAPLVEYLHRDSSISLTVACEQQDQGDILATKFPGVQSTYLNAQENPSLLNNLVSNADVVVSILPADMHHVVAKACVDQGTHMVTASYLNEKIKQLHEEALQKGVTILNEVGLDPGIDHLLALEAIQEIKALGGKVTAFESFCGGLPAPEFSDNPLRYKFSWSPRSALLNTISSAKYLENGKTVTISEGGELMAVTKPLHFLPGFNLEGFPNRDSTVYAKYYGIEDADTVLRGTLRYRGFAKAARVLQLLGLLEQEPHPCLHRQGPDITWRFLICNMLGLNDDNIFYDNLKSKIVERTQSELAVEVLEELGLLDSSGVVKCGTPLDTLTYYLSNKLSLGEK